ncbi:oxygen-dependent tRNA uridine(34) hydroxylase TrhO [Sphingomonas sp. CFBP 13720]|uniref:oxygen-dependent tRNA uridine(34) hydroxylase TrhO n=1 Tax=Sphingomonas sp. CFBP 13720 TaxID=2775302 RepID=UPI00177E1BDE|nr:rhodanese-related sulfurtransferase [Sphingomonas sp. CFBP 13720]MBD8677593.1 rhodanese-related sulfurtransferase [Sphingomonas sp. CFBP 13720]
MAEVVRVAALYRFVAVADPQAVRDRLETVLACAGVRGTLLVAGEGLNGTIAGSTDGIDAALAAIRALPGCDDLMPKFAESDTMPFHRLKVRVKAEIVTMGVPGTDPNRIVGTYVAPADWNALIADPQTVVIDTRNAYEVKVGTFAGAIDPGTDSFRDFPDWFRANRDTLLAGKRKVAMFCTGGIRCEKSTAFLKAEGVADVFHLEGGILKYLEMVQETESAWNGECFVFDERVAVGHGLAVGSHALCRGCRMPVSAADRASPLFEDGVQCPACAGTRDAATLAGKAERHRQVALAAARGEQHVGARVAPPGQSSEPPSAASSPSTASAGGFWK